MREFKKIFNLLEKRYKGKSPWIETEEELEKAGLSPKKENYFLEPFSNLIIGILSQNTSDRNSTKAFIGLIKKFRKISPKILAKAPLKEIEATIKPGGLWKVKAKRIKELAKIVLEKYGGNLNKILNLTEEKAKEELLSLPGIGKKTADVFMAYLMKKDKIPIDTNIARVARRLGIVKKSTKYEEIQLALSKILPKNKKIKAHEYLIRLGRDFCKARKPLCDICPISIICKKRF